MSAKQQLRKESTVGGQKEAHQKIENIRYYRTTQERSAS
jgi:hypothetical protein